MCCLIRVLSARQWDKYQSCAGSFFSDHINPKYSDTLSPLDMTEKLLTGTYSINLNQSSPDLSYDSN